MDGATPEITPKAYLKEMRERFDHAQHCEGGLACTETPASRKAAHQSDQADPPRLRPSPESTPPPPAPLGLRGVAVVAACAVVPRKRRPQ
jgi:hypothetical protein